MIAWAEPLETVLDRVASLTAAYTGARYCMIRLFDGDTLRLAAAPNFPPEMYEQIAVVAVDAQMPSARAALDREEIFVADTVEDPSTAAVASLAASLGIAASWSVPIELPNRNAVAGTLTLLFERRDDDRDRPSCAGRTSRVPRGRCDRAGAGPRGARAPCFPRRAHRPPEPRPAQRPADARAPALTTP